MTPTSYVIAIGSNRRHPRHGGPDHVVAAAVDAMATLGTVEAQSRVIRTPAMGPAGRSFVNGAAILRSNLAPDALLDGLKAIERSFGRRRGRRWGARVLDLDIILWSGGAWGGNGLTVPHPEFRQRRFVLVPVVQIAPLWRDPVTGRSIRQLRRAVDRRAPRA